MSFSCISVHSEAFSLIVFVQLLSLTIWYCSLLIMIISKSLSCIVHLCNTIFSMQYARHTPPFLPIHFTHFLHLRRNLSNLSSLKTSLTLEYHTYKSQRGRKWNTSLISCVKMGYCIHGSGGWICTAGTMDKISQYFSLRTIWLSVGRNDCYKAVLGSATLPLIKPAITQLLNGWRLSEMNEATTSVAS